MALSRVKTWIAAEVLNASDLNAEFDNILNNAISLISPVTAALDMNGFEFILDADGDTSITADTDDQIDFRIGGTDRASLKSACAGIVQMLDRDVTIASISASAVETTVYTYSLPASALGTNSGVRVTAHVDTTTAGTDVWTFRLKYGSTTLATVGITATGATTDEPAIFVGTFYNDGATNSQKGTGHAFVSSFYTVSTHTDSLVSAEDSTGALNIVLTMQCSTGTGSAADCHAVFTELLP